METYSYRIAMGLSSRGWLVTVVTSDWNYRRSDTNHSPNVRTIYVPALRIGGLALPLFQLRRQLLQIQPTVVHTNGPEPYSDIAALLAKIHGIPCVMTHHARLEPPSIVRRYLARIEERFFPLLYDRIIVTTTRSKQRLSDCFPQDRIHITPLAASNASISTATHIDRSEARKKLALPLNKHIVLFVGRLDRQHYYKGLDLLLKSFPLLEMPPETVHLVVVGDGELRQSYQSLSSRMGISDRVFFSGSVDDDHLAQHYAAADLFVLPSSSETEGFGIVLLEAMSLSIPVVTTDKPGLAHEIGEHDAGVVVRSGTPQALAKAISMVLRDETLRRLLAARSKAFASRFDWCVTVSETERVYRLLVDAGATKKLKLHARN